MRSFSAVPARSIPLLFACVATLAVGCNEKAFQSGRRADADAAPAPAGLTQEQASRVIAKVGDRTITLGDYAATLERMDQFDRLRYQSPERRKELLDEIIDVELLAQDAKAKGLDKDPQTEESIRQILRDALLKQAHEGGRTPSEVSADEVRAYYEAHRDEYREPERRRVAHIVFAAKDKELATKVLAEAQKATAMQWGELVQKYSAHKPPKPSPSNPLEMSGDLGIVGPPGDPKGDNPTVPDAVRAAAFEIARAGQVLDRLVPSGDELHVVRLLSKTDAHERTLAEADRSIRVAIVQEDIQKREKALEEKLRKQFPVTIDEAALAHVEMPPGAHKGGSDAGASAADAGK